MQPTQYPNFEGIQYFRAHSTTDNWGNPLKISPKLLLELDKFRQHIKKPVHVTSGFRTGNPNSQHAQGRAVDIVVPTFDGALLDLFFEASRFGFNGIGVYPDWRFKGAVVGGLHLDIRSDPVRALWIGYSQGGGNIYVKLDSANLKTIPGILDN